MKVNKDLAEASLMLALIFLVLVSTSEFENPTIKTATMVGFGIFAILMGVFRVIGARQEKEE